MSCHPDPHWPPPWRASSAAPRRCARCRSSRRRPRRHRRPSPTGRGGQIWWDFYGDFMGFLGIEWWFHGIYRDWMMIYHHFGGFMVVWCWFHRIFTDLIWDLWWIGSNMMIQWDPFMVMNICDLWWFIIINQWPFQEPIHWRYLPYIRPM